MYAAHVTKDGKEESCREHAIKVATYCQSTLEPVGLSATGYLIGLMHDMGKDRQAFDDYIHKAARGEKVRRGSVDHATAGCVYFLNKFFCLDDKEWYDYAMVEMLVYVIASHHGERDCLNRDGDSLFEQKYQKREEISYEGTWNIFQTDVADDIEISKWNKTTTQELKSIIIKIANYNKDKENRKDNAWFQLGLLARLMLSALVDADRQATAEFMQQELSKYRYRFTSKKELRNFWIRQIKYFDDKYGELQEKTKRTEINDVRKIISEQCMKNASLPSGIYQLNVPTGGGKTLAGLRYALNHACKYGKKKIIFVIPLLSVLEQNSKVIQEYIVDKDALIEHHSNVIMDKSDTENADTIDGHMYEMLIENWESPMIITTLVQLLNTLFSGKMSSVRRMQALCNSIIVIDEIQSIPKKLISMFNIAMNFLVSVCGCCIVLSSATQPELTATKHAIVYADNKELVSLTQEQRRVFNRTTLHNCVEPYGKCLDELASFGLSVLDNRSSVLIICNTKRSARKLFQLIELQKDEDTKLYYLSASMCQLHRINILSEIEDALKPDQHHKLICVATQVIEAGIDVSFESVIRVIAGMDNVVQAAGRCNRNGEFGKSCDVFIVNLKADEEKLQFLPDIKEARDAALSLLEQYKTETTQFQNCLLSDQSISWYYKKLYSTCNEKLDFPLGNSEYTLFDLLSLNKLRRRENQNKKEGWKNQCLVQSFQEAGDKFCVFEENTTDVIVPYNKEACKVIQELYSEKALYDYAFVKRCISEAKRYTIHIFEHEKNKLIESGFLHYGGDGRFCTLDEECYSKKWGFDIEGNNLF